ncbi:SDR family oxidoreductase [Pseudonocardia ailaonensis]|uniref:SDR family oxidoreductase n=1 Tax=Pseudonocardia ailaonensis TaxID=367279 RepID=A0ABN2MYZ6_9PSEU
MSSNLSGRVAVVTGAGAGIGRAAALELASHGATVVVNDRGSAHDGTGSSTSPAQFVVDEITALGGTARTNPADVGDFDQVAELVRSTVGEFGRLDIIVNNAGHYRAAPIWEMSEDDWDSIIRVHLKGQFNLIRNAAPVFMAQRYGRILNMSSRSGLGDAGKASYSAAKEGVIGLTRAVARELGPHGVTCNAVRPIAKTRLMPVSAAGLSVVADIPEPEELAPVMAYLVSERAANVNGATFLLRGSQVALYSEPELLRTAYCPAGGWTFESFALAMGDGLGADLRNEWTDFDPGKKVIGRVGASIV